MTTRGPKLFVVVARSRKRGGENGFLSQAGSVVAVVPSRSLFISLLYFHDRATCVPSGSVQVVVVTALL